ncbi:MAG: hypothetical protein AB7G12_09380 [Thermoanaerobaculia bacterium]
MSVDPVRGWSGRTYRVAGLGLLLGGIASFALAVGMKILAPEHPATTPIVWSAIALNLVAFIWIPAMLLRLMSRRGLDTRGKRLVVSRAVWGGPFGTIGALWDLTAGDPAAPPGSLPGG